MLYTSLFSIIISTPCKQDYLVHQQFISLQVVYLNWTLNVHVYFIIHRSNAVFPSFIIYNSLGWGKNVQQYILMIQIVTFFSPGFHYAHVMILNTIYKLTGQRNYTTYRRCHPCALYNTSQLSF